MQRLLLLLAFVAPVCVDAGQGPADSLARVLERHLTRDSDRVTTLLRLADAIVYTDPARAMGYADEALNIASAIQWTKGIALSLRQKGNVYYVFSDDSSAMEYYMRSLRTARSLGIRPLDASLFNNLANIYSDLRQYTRALDYYRQFLTVSRDLDDAKDQVIALVNMGTVYAELGEHRQALDCDRQALDIARSRKNTYFIPVILNNMGIAFGKNGDNDSALACYQRCISLADKYDNQDAKASSLEETSRIYLGRGDLAHARQYTLASLAIARQLHSSQWQADAWESLSTLDEREHSYADALKSYKQYIVFRDSVTNEEKRSALTRKELQFDFERKEAAFKAESEKKDALARAEINRQNLIRRGTVAASIILLLAGCACFVLYKRRRDADQKRTESDFKATVTETEMKVLRLQMNPHFIFNSLNAVSDYICRHETETANFFLIRFARMMRQVLENSEKSEITLAEDLQALETYMQLESLRVRNGFTYQITIDPYIDPELTLVPPLIVQPFVENSIWHGFSGRSCPGKISIGIRGDDGMITYIVEDDGIGREKAAARTSAAKRSMGMNITRERIDIINKTKRTAASLHVYDLPGGTKVELRLPLELKY
jgi:tetratricopeptide (TPR) repeat protein